MILSSADILRVLGSSEIIRLSASISIVDSKPSLSGAEGLFIHIGRFPSVDEFEATWTLWVESDGSEPDDLVIEELKRLLPSVKTEVGLLTKVTTTDFRSESTQTAPKEPKPVLTNSVQNDYEERFQSLLEDVQDQMLLVHSGTAGKDGLNGADGADGKDAELGDVNLFDLADCDRGIALQKGQVLTWDGSGWTNLYIPQVSTIFGGGGGSGDGEGVIISDGAPDARDDGSELQDGDQWWQSTTGVMYIWYVDTDGGQWVQSSSGEGGGGGSSTLAGLLDTETAGVADGDVLVYRGATGNWTAETAPETGLQSGDNISELTNDVGYITLAEVPETGLQAGDNISELVNDVGYITAAEVPESGIEEAPQDGNYYVRQDGTWINLSAALSALNDKTIDGGNLTTGSSAGDEEVVDGGDFTAGTAYYID